MTDDLLPILRARYPQFFSAGRVREIGCYAGWLELIDELCQGLALHLFSCPETSGIEVVQVKEKFGELRFYIDGGDQYCQALIADTKARSLITCEVCGAQGALIGERWVSVRCTKHLYWRPGADE